jgi:hypothetical protein
LRDEERHDSHHEDDHQDEEEQQHSVARWLRHAVCQSLIS